MSEIELIFLDDIKDKKRTAHRSTKSNQVIYPVDLLSGIQKRNYKKGSKIVSYNREEITTLEEFKKLPVANQKDLFEYWLNEKLFSQTKIRKAWDLSDHHLRMLIAPLDIQITNPALVKKQEAMTIARKTWLEKSPEERAERKKSKQVVEEIVAEMVEEREEVIQAEPIAFSGFTMNVQMNSAGNDLITALQRHLLFLEADNRKYRIDLVLEELEPRV